MVSTWYNIIVVKDKQEVLIMKYAIKSLTKYLGEDGQIKFYDNVDDAVQAVKDFAEALRFMLSVEDNMSYGTATQMMPFDANHNLMVPDIVINELNNDGSVYTSVDHVEIVDGERAVRKFQEDEAMRRNFNKKLEELSKYIKL